MRFRVTLTGTLPLLMHNAQLSDPLNPHARAMKSASAKRKKTDADHEDMARLEFLGGLYYDPDAGPFVPGDNIQRCLVDAAKLTRSGRQVTRGVFISTDINPVAYRGPRDPAELWLDENFRHRKSVKVGMSRVMRTRPMFQQWAVEADGELDETELNLEELQEIADAAGTRIGLGDWRPRFGRFTSKVEAL
ncbi:hypothetical protein [Streptomyces sp. NPDC001194]|uniref:hypothetical protein n=1 Tax=Streptomyces sp. NPDC001194 TaxID=3364547 RepID=UPI0036C5AE6F